MSQTKTAGELASLVNGRLIGDATTPVDRIADLEGATKGEVAYVDNEKFFARAQTCEASCLLVPVGTSSLSFTAPAVIEVSNPKLAFSLVAPVLHPPFRREAAIHSTAVVAGSAEVSPSAFVGPHTSIGEYARVGANTRIETGTAIGANVIIGDDCVIHPNVVLYDGVSIGNRVILHAGVCVGADGFGYVRDDMGYHKFPQIGTVMIDDDVEIGAHTCIDRAALGRTRIGRGTKLDNLVHVGHNCDIGERVVIAAQTGISGSVVIEDDAVIGGQVGFGDHTRVQKGAIIGSKAGILPGKIVRPGVWWGIPVQPLHEYKRLNAHISRLPQMRDELKELKKELAELRSQLKQNT